MVALTSANTFRIARAGTNSVGRGKREGVSNSGFSPPRTPMVMPNTFSSKKSTQVLWPPRRESLPAIGSCRYEPLRVHADTHNQ